MPGHTGDVSPSNPFDFWGLGKSVGDLTHGVEGFTHGLSEQFKSMFVSEDSGVAPCTPLSNNSNNAARTPSIPEQRQENKMKTRHGRRLSDTDTPGNGVHEYHPDYRLAPNPAASKLFKTQSLKPALKPQSSLRAPLSAGSAVSLNKSESIRSSRSSRSTADSLTDSSAWGDEEMEERRKKALGRSSSIGRHWKRSTHSVPKKNQKKETFSFGKAKRSRSPQRLQKTSTILSSYKW